MLKLGKKQQLTVVKRVEFGIYLAERDNEEQKVLLPKKQIPDDIQIGDDLEVFLYKDSKDRLIATIREPLLQIGKPAVLKVAQVGIMGAFLDWGLEKDLLLPFREQTKEVKEGEQYMVALYIDKSSRLCATMNVYEYLDTDSPYHKEDTVTGIVYETSKEFGAFVAVDNKFSALIPAREFHGEVQIGDIVEARVTDVKEDGKLDLSIRKKSYLQMDEDSEKIMKMIEASDGTLPFNDKADPEIIKTEAQMSKNAFKRAVGRLLKEGRVEITPNSIKKANK